MLLLLQQLVHVKIAGCMSLCSQSSYVPHLLCWCLDFYYYSWVVASKSIPRREWRSFSTIFSRTEMVGEVCRGNFNGYWIIFGYSVYCVAVGIPVALLCVHPSVSSNYPLSFCCLGMCDVCPYVTVWAGDDLSLHAALPVTRGEKWLANFWIWDPKRK